MIVEVVNFLNVFRLFVIKEIEVGCLLYWKVGIYRCVIFEDLFVYV